MILKIIGEIRIVYRKEKIKKKIKKLEFWKDN